MKTLISISIILIFCLVLMVEIRWYNGESSVTPMPLYEMQFKTSIRPTSPSHEYMKLWNIHSDMKNNWLHSIFLTRSETRRASLNSEYVALRQGIESIMDMTMQQRFSDLQNMTKSVQSKIHNLQHPEDCKKARLLICHIQAICGFGCYTHLITNCLLQAIESGRTMVYRSTRWGYAKDGWEFAFLPPGKCEVEKNTEEIPIIAENNSYARVVKTWQHDVPSWLPWSIPKEIATTLLQSHGDPFAWWIGQIIEYLLRPQPWLDREIKRRMEELEIRSPIVGLQIRRGDKILNEARYHPVEEYMVFVEQWYRQPKINNKNVTKTVFLATEDATVLPELKEKYPDYVFKVKTVLIETLQRSDRYNENGLTSIILDMFLLSHCDYLVCTMSSNVCRIPYELMMNFHADASMRIQSVDMPHRFKTSSDSHWRVILNHIPAYGAEIELLIGDIVLVPIKAFSNYNTGSLTGMNRRTKKTGIFPAFKVRQVVRTHNFKAMNDDGT